jgi:hypothetical protein
LLGTLHANLGVKTGNSRMRPEIRMKCGCRLPDRNYG